MKQLLFLLLFPCLALAQYQGNGNQKITLGEQTSADGLVWRGRTSDTSNLMTNKLDTSAYLVLDTITEAIWLYRASTTPKWNRVVDSLNNLQGQLSLTTKVTDVLPVVNGGTGSTTKNFVDLTTTQSIAGLKTFTSVATFSSNVNTSGDVNLLGNEQYVNLYSNYDKGQNARARIRAVGAGGGSGYGGDFRVSTRASNNAWNTDVFILNSTGAATFSSLGGTGDRTVIASASGVLSAPTSSITTKENVQILNYGLNEILQINPVSFNYIDKDKWGEERKLGFIVEDIFPIIPEVTGTMNDGDLYLDMVKLIPILTKAIQEQQALIKALEQRILTLENK